MRQFGLQAGSTAGTMLLGIVLVACLVSCTLVVLAPSLVYAQQQPT